MTEHRTRPAGARICGWVAAAGLAAGLLSIPGTSGGATIETNQPAAGTAALAAALAEPTPAAGTAATPAGTVTLITGDQVTG